MKDIFPESLGQQCGYALYMAKYGTYCLQFLTGLNLLPTAALRSPGDLDLAKGRTRSGESAVCTGAWGPGHLGGPALTQ